MSTEKKAFLANTILPIAPSEPGAKIAQSWISENTAILIIHGIGNQNPLETLDAFGRGLIETYWNELHFQKSDFTVTHEVAIKTTLNGSKWFDNFIRISKQGELASLDLYEYYWANLTEDKASMTKIQSWVSDVVHQAKKFYEENIKMEEHSVETKFIKKKSGKDPETNASKVKFKGLRYKLFLMLVSIALPIFNWLLGFPRWIGKMSPVATLGLSNAFDTIATWLETTLSTKMANVIGDLVIYNTADEKSSLYEIRKNILAGAVNAARYLIEPQAGNERAYGKVLLAGHSLGTQIAYDTINRINHLTNFGEIKGVHTTGALLDKNDTELVDQHVSNLLCGLITFGSPLDKIAFFLREHVDHENILMLQIINDYHSFRQRDWYNIDDTLQEIPVRKTISRLFEDIPWRNYFDKRDYVSGPLDFYNKVTNIDCAFPSKFYSFTHANYWKDRNMYKDIVLNFLN